MRSGPQSSEEPAASEPAPAAPEPNPVPGGAMRAARRMVLWTVGAVMVAIALLVVLAPPSFLEFRLSVLLKLGAGVLATIVLAALLMAASFYSDRTGHDDGPSGH